MFKNLFEHSTRKMNDILSSVAKWNLWEGIDEKKAQNAKKQVFKKVDGSDNFNIKIDLKKEIVSAWQSLKDIRDIAYEFEKDGQMLGGSFGTNPYAAERYLKKEGYKVTTIKGEDIVNKDIPDADAYLLSFWNTDDVMDGLHTVSVKKEKDNTYTFYNDDAIEEEEVPASSIPKRIEVKHYQPIILQCIYKKDE